MPCALAVRRRAHEGILFISNYSDPILGFRVRGLHPAMRPWCRTGDPHCAASSGTGDHSISRLWQDPNAPDLPL